MRTDVHAEILNLYPAFEKIINNLYKSEDHFRTLCEDICDCQIMIQKLKNEKNQKVEYLKEYETLYTELITELSDTLNEHKTNYSHKKEKA